MKTKFITAILFLIGFCLVGQEKLPSDTFRIVKSYEPTLVDANKISFEPEIDDDLKIDIDLNYSFINKTVPVKFEVDPIAPARIKGEPLVKLYNGYARLGVGNALLPFAELYYNNLRSKKYSIGGHAKYFNMAEVNKIEGSDMSQMHYEVFGQRFWKTNTLDASISFDRHDFNYYGFYNIPFVSPSEATTSQLEQHYNRLSGVFKLKSTKRDSFNLRHEGSIEYKMLANASSNQEHNVKVKANLNQFKNSELYNLDVLVDYNQYDFNSDNTILAVKPQISTIGEKFRVNAGLGIYINAGSSTDFHFYPIAEVKYNVIEDVLVPYAGIKGEVKRVNYNSITLENPFIAEQITLVNSNEKYNLYAGLRGTLSSKVSFNISGANVKTEDAYLYIQLPNNILSSNKLFSKEYYLTYDDINEYQIKGELVYRLNEKIQVYALGEYFNFDTEREVEAWHRPELKISTSARYNLRDKIAVKLDLIYWGEQYAQGVEEYQLVDPFLTEIRRRPTVEKLDGIFDANLSFEYRYTKRLSAFIQFNNIAGINFEKYQNYPTQGFNVWGGLTYSF